MNELRLFLYVISQIPWGYRRSSQGTPTPSIEVSERVVARVLNLTGSKRSWASRLTQIIHDMKVAYASIVDADGRTFNISWFRCIAYDPGKKMFTFTFDSMLMPFFCGLSSGRFTLYELGYVFQLSSVHSVRLYDTLKEFAHRGDFYVSLNDLRTRLGLLLYDENKKIVGYKVSDFKKLNAQVLGPAVSEINDRTDLKVSYVAQRGVPNGPGRAAVEGIVFTVHTKENFVADFSDLEALNKGGKVSTVSDEQLLKFAISDEPPAQLSLWGSTAEGGT